MSTENVFGSFLFTKMIKYLHKSAKCMCEKKILGKIYNINVNLRFPLVQFLSKGI